MQRTLVIPCGLWKRLRPRLFPKDGAEGFIAGLARPCRTFTGIRYVMEQSLDMAEEGFDYRHEAGLALTRDESSRLNIISAKAAEFGLVPVHLHSHPDGTPDFSSYDDKHEAALHGWLNQQGQPLLLSLVCARDAMPRARLWHGHGHERCRVRIGLQTIFSPEESASTLPALDRQRAFGKHFTDAVADLSVGIVGLGGVGMPVAEQLARSGFQRFVFMDPDKVEVVNLNRLSGLRCRDVGRFKTDVATAAVKRACNSVGTAAWVRTCRADINTASKQQRALLGRCDLILALTDDELSRICCLTLALEHGAEYLQAGVRIGQNADTGTIDSIKTEVTGAETGRYCPICSGRLDPGQASIEARRYIGGEVYAAAKAGGYIPEEPAPSVMSLNAIAAGALVLEIQKRVAGLEAVDLMQQDWLTGDFLHIQDIEECLSDDKCAICGRNRLPQGVWPHQEAEPARQD